MLEIQPCSEKSWFMQQVRTISFLGKGELSKLNFCDIFGEKLYHIFVW